MLPSQKIFKTNTKHCQLINNDTNISNEIVNNKMNNG